MEKKRPIGILFAALFVVMIGLWIFLRRVYFNFTYLLPKELFLHHSMDFVLLSLGYAAILLPLSLQIGAVGLFCHKPWGRRVIVISLSIDVFIQILGIIISLFGKKFLNPNHLIIQAYFIALAEMMLVYYLTRQRVKEHFKVKKI